MPQRVWLLAGIAAAQFLAIGLPVPMLLWEAGWIGMLGIEPWMAARGAAPSTADRLSAKDPSAAKAP